MRVHSLDCGTMLPRLVGRLVCHVLLCETDDGLVLVDSGFGTADLTDRRRRLGAVRRVLRPTYEPAGTALRQVQALGFAAQDVRHIVLTHLDLDHAGGLSDFPGALVHTTAAEHTAAVVSPGVAERARYHPAQWSHGPRWQTYDRPGETWNGFAAAHPLEGLDARFALVPMAGHSRGHAAVAVQTAAGWLLHAGDAAFDRSSVEPAAPRRALLAFEQVVAVDRRAVRDNHRRLAELQAGGTAEVITAHDPVLLARRQA